MFFWFFIIFFWGDLEKKFESFWKTFVVLNFWNFLFSFEIVSKTMTISVEFDSNLCFHVHLAATQSRLYIFATVFYTVCFVHELWYRVSQQVLCFLEILHHINSNFNEFNFSLFFNIIFYHYHCELQKYLTV